MFVKEASQTAEKKMEGLAPFKRFAFHIPSGTRFAKTDMRCRLLGSLVKKRVGIETWRQAQYLPMSKPGNTAPLFEQRFALRKRQAFGDVRKWKLRSLDIQEVRNSGLNELGSYEIHWEEQYRDSLQEELGRAII